MIVRARLVFIICVDADPDRPRSGGVRYDCPDRLTWDHLPKLVSRFHALRKDLFDKSSVHLCVTWFARADLQIKRIYGSAGWALKEFEALWKQVIDGGDELAWHPHSWRWNRELQCWYSEMNDMEYIRKNYDVGFEAFKQGWGSQPFACRAGINFHSNYSVAKLDELGIKTDLSAHPGLKLFYSAPKWGCPIQEGFDWTRAPNEPYHPSRDDYQSPSQDDERLELLEIPVTVWRKQFGSLSHLMGLVPFRNFKITRPAFKGWFLPNVWGNQFRFEQGIKEALRRAMTQGIAHYSSYLHPDDVTDFRVLSSNLENAIKLARENSVELDFSTAKQAYDLLK